MFAAGLFPVCPATHDAGISRLFDLSTLLLLLYCRPGDRVLDLGAGPGFASETLARLGYDVVALDPDHLALQQTRRRPTYDPTRIEGTVRVTQGIAERLPFADACFDGVLGMNVLHHVPDLPPAITELARVLRPGCRAVFCEPGLDHLETATTQRAIRELGENDQGFDVLAFLHAAKERGFAQAMLTATLQSQLRLLPIEDVDLYRSGNHPHPPLTPHGVVDELHRRRAFAMLQREGSKPKTSRSPGVLRCELAAQGVPERARRGERFTVMAHVSNAGDSIWLSHPTSNGGYVTAGCKLLSVDGRLITDRLGRTCLPRDLAPGEHVTVPIMIVVPADLTPGRYRLQFDMVDELICWFSDLSADPASYQPLTIV